MNFIRSIYAVVCLVGFLSLVAVPSLAQYEKLEVDVQDRSDFLTLKPFWVGNNLLLQVDIFDDDEPANFTGWDLQFNYAEDKYSPYVATIDAVSVDSNTYTFSATNQFSKEKNDYFFSVTATNTSYRTTLGSGKLSIEFDPSGDNPDPLIYAATVKWDNIDNFEGTWPITFSTNYFTVTTNGTGRIDVDLVPTAGAGDLVEVQVSGGLLTVASGEGPTPVVGLTTASLNSAESDPNAVLLTGAQTVGGLKTFSEGLRTVGIGTDAHLFSDATGNFLNLSAQGLEVDAKIIPANSFGIDLGESGKRWGTVYVNGFDGDGSNITSLNASELDSGTIPLARIVDLTSNEVATATDTAYRNVAETDPNAVLLTGAQTVAGAKTFTDTMTVTNDTLALLTVKSNSGEAFTMAAGSNLGSWLISGGTTNNGIDFLATSQVSGQNLLTITGNPLEVRGDINPLGAYDLGSASAKWANIYATNFIGGGASLTDIGFSGFDTDVSDTMQFVIGSYLDSPEVSVASDGATITLSIEQSGGGDLRVVFSDGVYTEDTTPAATVTLTAGSDTVPQINYVYLLQSTKTLTASTSGWPATEHAPVATVLAQSAASLQTDGAYKLHAWTDHIKSDDEGHLSHINFWIRSQPATWIDGIALTPTAGAGQLDIATTSGNVLQLHPHDFPAFDTDTLGSRLMTVNYPGDNYKEALDLTQTYIDVDANGNTLGDQATDFYNLVVWGVVSEGGANSHLMINLPDGSYNSDAGSKASDDTENTAVYDIPSDFTGVGFLIARLTIQESAGTYTIIRNTDLRGQTPATSAGGGATGGNEFADSVFRIQDTDDVTREIAFDAGTITTGNTRTLTAPDASGTLVVSGSIGPTEISVGYTESNPFVITSSATPTIDIDNGPFQKLTQAQNITSITWDFGGTSSGGNISLELIDGDSYTQVWGVGNWVGGSNGTIENPWEQVIFHGTNSTALTGAELDADL